MKLTDEQLTDLVVGANSSERVRYLACETVHELREYRALDEHHSRSDKELKERRAADLTAFESTVLLVLRNRIDEDPLGDRAMVDILDKLLARGIGK